MEILFSSPVDVMQNESVIFVGLYENTDLFGRISVLDQQSSSFISKALKSSTFTAKPEESLSIFVNDLVEGYPELRQIIPVGLGKQADFDSLSAEKLGTQITSIMKSYKISKASVLLDGIKDEYAVNIAFGIKAKDYVFDKYKTQKKAEEKTHLLESVTLAVENHEHASSIFKEKVEPLLEGITLAKNLVNEPANTLNPDSYANIVKDINKTSPNLKVEILDEKAMQKLGMNALLGVGQGSACPSKLAVVKYNGSSNKDDPTIALVGKGVTFDTGGVSLKPSRGMWDMISDMAGSAAVLGAISALANQGVKANVVAVLGIVENAVSGNAQRPGDIVKSASGQTIEVLNTDAEGRLVLADALWYAQEHLKAKHVIDVATLTGAIVVALGHDHAGLFSNNDALAEKLLQAGGKVGEKLWKMPMSKNYDELINSDAADMKNISTKGHGADSITAAQFLRRFIKDDTQWAHLDIAGVAWNNSTSHISPKGASAFGVRLLTQFVSDIAEKSA
ncbi:cytosol aminopeptidase family, catalytic domain protein [Neorickettsia helminthoeca str. Oregon]|uniref:Probable cytosol aminopeptidase n=1 Tax=Neorickettsia helminthoeca str. Oregon TaxID=1286528 RepID=X5HJY5_9RICK|nr:leucyl aminopeptidase [Neorickettsia helminthoeca]AHX11394.1 cytosol aminopeptidase family, catalytic domain protein [Neorickettsia helminthoeca str. Oregon]